VKAQRTEKLNPNLINPESKLGFEVHNIRNIYKGESNEPYKARFTAECEGTRKEIGINDVSDNWQLDKIFEFPIEKGNEYLYVKAQDISSQMNEHPESELIVVIDLKELRDQKLHSNTYKFRYSNDEDALPEMDCSLLWKYNLAKFYSDMIHEEQQMIDMGIEHNQKLQANIRELHQPFPQMAETSMGQSNVVHVFSKKAPDLEEQQLDYVNPFTENNITRKAVDPMTEGKFTRTGQQSNSLITRVFLYLLIFYLFVALMTHLYRDLFLDLIVGFLLLSAWYFDIP